MSTSAANRDAHHDREQEHLPPSVSENIDTITAFYQRHEERMSLPQRIIEKMSVILGSPGYVAASVVFMVGWIVANLAALEHTSDAPEGLFRAFNVGSGVVHTIGDMAEALSRAAGGPDPVTTGEYRLGDVRHITASSERLRTELGWSPDVTFEDGMLAFATAPLRAAVRR